MGYQKGAQKQLDRPTYELICSCKRGLCYYADKNTPDQLILWSGPDGFHWNVQHIVAKSPISIKKDDGRKRIGFPSKGNWSQKLLFRDDTADRDTWLQNLKMQCALLDIKVEEVVIEKDLTHKQVLAQSLA